MERRAFEDLVSKVLDGLPPDFAEKLDNVEVVVEDRPSPEVLSQQGVGKGQMLLGLYQGVPLTRRGWGYEFVLPDKICIYREPIERVCAGTGGSIGEMTRKVVLHEIAHHFGIPDSRLRELGY